MRKIIDFLNYQIHLGGGITFTPQALLIIIGVFILTYFLLKLFKKIIVKTLSSDAQAKFRSIFSFFNYSVYLIVILITLDNVGVNVTAIFAASAALLVGIGLALQTLIQDVISGIFILADQTVHVGDIIQVDGQVGKVENIKLRTTRAVTRDNKVLIIPNHKFLTSILYNWTENGSLTRESISIGIAYGSDVNVFKEAVVAVAAAHPYVLKKPEPFVLFEDFGDSALLFDLFFSIDNSFKANVVKSDIRFQVFDKLKELDIEIPFPQRTITIKNNPEPSK